MSPAVIPPPQLDPAGATERALSTYDANKDQKMSKDELKACPGLLASIEYFDGDGDGAISGDEMRTNLEMFQKESASLVGLMCVVEQGKKPLAGATVKFVPESFLGDAVKPASGVTADDGMTKPSVPDEDIPAKFRGKLQGVPCGIFRVEVTHPDVKVPEKYNTKTELGRLISRRNSRTMTISF